MTSSEEIFDGSGGSTYIYAVAGSKDGGTICHGESDRMVLSGLLIGAALDAVDSDRPACVLHGYCVDEFSVRAVIETSSLQVVRDVLRPLSRRYTERMGTPTRDCGARALIDEFAWERLYLASEMLAAVRYCHMAPVSTGVSIDATVWQSSGNRGYLALAKSPGLTRSTVALLLANGPGGWPLGYEHLMQEPELGINRLRQWNRDVPVLPRPDQRGDRGCLAWFKRQQTEREGCLAFNGAVSDACLTTGCDSGEFLANPSSPRFQLERARVVIALTQNKSMTINEVAQRLRCDRSWIYRTLKEFRSTHPDMFAETLLAAGAGEMPPGGQEMEQS